MNRICNILPVFFLLLSSFCLSQEDKRGTIKVKKPASEIRDLKRPWTDTVSFGIVKPEAGNGLIAASEQMPGFPGGNKNLYVFIDNNLKYPEKEKVARVQGTVYVQFVVLADGALSNISVLKGVLGGPGLEEEAIRIVKRMPKWTPGRQNGQVVPVEVNLPVKFQL